MARLSLKICIQGINTVTYNVFGRNTRRDPTILMSSSENEMGQ